MNDSKYSSVLINWLKGQWPLIDSNRYKEFYQNLSLLGDPHFPYDEVYTLFKEADINPLEYMDILPPNFLYRNDTETSLTIPSHIKSITTFSIQDCLQLEKIIIENGVERIEDSAITFCPQLRIIYLPPSINLIYPNAFTIDPQITLFVVVQDSYAHTWCRDYLKNENYTLIETEDELNDYL